MFIPKWVVWPVGVLVYIAAAYHTLGILFLAIAAFKAHLVLMLVLSFLMISEIWFLGPLFLAWAAYSGIVSTLNEPGLMTRGRVWKTYILWVLAILLVPEIVISVTKYLLVHFS